jgi:hypothetical protein
MIRLHVEASANIITDSLHSYKGLDKEFGSHEVIKHDEDSYVIGHVHTNTIEGAFSHLKRMIYGIYHHVSPKHLARYCDESSYKYNSRKLKDDQRFVMSLGLLDGRLTYKSLINTAQQVQPERTFPMMEERISNRPRILQIKDGKVIGRYPSACEAARQTGCNNRFISYTLKGQRKSTGGYEWKYE